MNRVLTFQIWHNRASAPSCKLVALALAQLCDRDADRCHASIRYLSVMTGLNRNTVLACVHQLESMGLITRYQAHRRAPTEYTLHPTR